MLITIERKMTALIQIYVPYSWIFNQSIIFIPLQSFSAMLQSVYHLVLREFGVQDDEEGQHEVSEGPVID